jgi:hypothetical protein
MWVASSLIEIPFMTLRVALKKRRLKCHFYRSGPHACMIHMLGSLMMTFLHIYSRMIDCIIFGMIFNHPLGHVMLIFLGMRTCCMRTLNHLRSHFWKNTRTWTSQSDLQSESIFILSISTRIQR